MSGAGSALEEGGVDYLWMNPASLRVKHSEWAGEYSTFQYSFTDGSALSEGGLRGAVPWGDGALGASWYTRGLADVAIEQSFALVGSWPASWLGESWVGVTVKWLNIQFPSAFAALSRPAFGSNEAQAWSWDVGMWGRVFPHLTWAAAVRDAGQPSISVVGEEARQPWEIRLGLAYQIHPSWQVVMDPIFRSGSGRVALGTEYRLFPSPLSPLPEGEGAGEGGATVRGGFLAAWPAGGSVQVVGGTAGFSYEWLWGGGRVQWGYAFEWPLNGLSTALGVHRVSMGYRPGTLRDPSESILSQGDPSLWAGLLPEVFFTRLMSPAEEWEEGQKTLNAEAPVVARHRQAVLTSVVAGLTAGEAAYQKLLTTEPTPFDAAAFRAIHRLRYESEPGALGRLLPAYREAAEVRDAPPEVILTKGFLLAKQGEWTASLEVYRQWWSLVRTGEPDAGSLHALVTVALFARDVELAEAGLAKLIVLVPDSYWVKEAYGSMVLSKGRSDEALEIFREAGKIAATPRERLRAALHRAVAASRSWREGSAEIVLNGLAEAESLVPESADVSGVRRQILEAWTKRWMEEGKIYEEKLLMKEALRAFREVLKLAPDHPQAAIRAARAQERIAEQVQAHEVRARQAMDARDGERALVEWKLVFDADPTHPEAGKFLDTMFPSLALKAKDRMKERFYQDAMKIIKLLNEVRPGDPAVTESYRLMKEGFSERAVAHERVEEYAKARDVWREYLDLMPEDAEAKKEKDRLTELARVKVEAYLREARGLDQQGAMMEALLMARKAMRVDPMGPEALDLEKRMTRKIEDSIKGWTAEAKKALKEGREHLAREFAQKILKVEPDHEEAKRFLQEALGMQSGRLAVMLREAQDAETRFDPQGALKWLGHLLAASPGHSEGEGLQKKIRERLQRAEKNQAAIKQEALQADVAYGQGRIAEAVAHWEKVLEWDYYHKEVRRNIEGAKKEIK